MEENKKTSENKDRDILFSRTIKAGQRIYYVDVKQNRKEEMYLSITESKKVTNGSPETPHINYEKHKLFIYREDFQKFRNSMQEAMLFIEENQGVPETRLEQEEMHQEEYDMGANEIKIDLEF